MNPVRFALLSLAAVAVSGPSHGYEPARAKQAFAAELVECASYYGIGVEAARRRGDEAGGQNAREASELALRLATELATAEQVDAALGKFNQAHASMMGGDYANYGVLVTRFGATCKSALEDPFGRMRYWLDRRGD